MPTCEIQKNKPFSEKKGLRKQIAMHELFHEVLSRNPGLRDQLINYLYDNYTEAEIARIVLAYSEAYDGIYGVDEGSEFKYLEEALCDVYAKIQRGQANTGIVQQTMGALSDQVDQALTRSQTEQAVRDTRGSPEVKFSIEDFVEGEKAVYQNVVRLDTNLFNGMPPRKWGAVLQNYFYQNLAGQQLTIYDENWYSETVEIARENDRVKKDGSKNSHKVIDKLARHNGDNLHALASIHAPELLEVSEWENHTDEHTHQWMDEKGWTHRHAIIETLDGKIYDATLNIAEGKNRRILYDISNIRLIDNERRTAGGAVPSTVAGRGSLTSHSSSGKNIAQANQSVKHFSSEQQTARINQDYLRTVQSGDMKTAQRMVDEAARKAGYSIHAYHGTQADFNVFHGGAFFTDDYFLADGYASGERVIDAYLKLENPLEIDAKGAKWDGLDSEYGRSTRDVAFNLDDQHDGVIFYNVADSWMDDEDAGEYTVYFVKDSSQAKSADPVTYDDEGNVIPLSERFEESKPDIRYSMAEDEETGETDFSPAARNDRDGGEQIATSPSAPRNDWIGAFPLLTPHS